jgi:hypothetical protein
MIEIEVCYYFARVITVRSFFMLFYCAGHSGTRSLAIARAGRCIDHILTSPEPFPPNDDEGNNSDFVPQGTKKVRQTSR